MTCPACGATTAAGARFCQECGQRLGASLEERRLATVLMADLVGFTTISAGADPEQIKRLVDHCFERLVADITAFGGRLDKIVGDEIIALFGAPDRPRGRRRASGAGRAPHAGDDGGASPPRSRSRYRSASA